MARIRVALIGVGNCASALVQGTYHYAQPGSTTVGLAHEKIGHYAVSDIEFAAAFDVDKRKVGIHLHNAIGALPNNTTQYCQKLPETSVRVSMGRVLDGVSSLHNQYEEHEAFRICDEHEPSKEDVVRVLKVQEVDVMVNFLPVGSQTATEFYAECALEARVAFVNCIPVFVASDAAWAERFLTRGVPLIGDDIKAQVGATIVHRTLSELFGRRGAAIDRTYQLNVGGNTDFLNMLDRSRLLSKKRSKTESVVSAMQNDVAPSNVHIGPSDYVPWLKDNKICFLRIEGRGFGGVPLHVEVRLSVEDSPNSAGVVVDAIRCAKIALDRREAGPIEIPSACFMKHPPRQLEESELEALFESYLASAAR